MAAAIPAYDLALDELCVALSYVTMTKVPVYTPPAAKAEEAPKKDSKVSEMKKSSSCCTISYMVLQLCIYTLTQQHVACSIQSLSDVNIMSMFWNDNSNSCMNE